MVGTFGSSGRWYGNTTFSTTPCCGTYCPVISVARDGEHGDECV